MSENGYLYGQLVATRESLGELWARIGGADSCDAGTCDGCGVSEDAQDELRELPLEIVWEKGEPFAVVLSTGGPHIEIRGGGRHDGMDYALHGYWSGEHVALSGASITRTGEYFRELVEECDS